MDKRNELRNDLRQGDASKTLSDEEKAEENEEEQEEQEQEQQEQEQQEQSKIKCIGLYG